MYTYKAKWFWNLFLQSWIITKLKWCSACIWLSAYLFKQVQKVLKINVIYEYILLKNTFKAKWFWDLFLQSWIITKLKWCNACIWLNTYLFQQVPRVAWWELWNFIECKAKFCRFLYTNWYIQKILWHLARLFESKLSKIGNFQSSKWIFDAKSQLIFLKLIFSSEHQSRITPFNKYFFI